MLQAGLPVQLEALGYALLSSRTAVFALNSARLLAGLCNWASLCLCSPVGQGHQLCSLFRWDFQLYPTVGWGCSCFLWLDQGAVQAPWLGGSVGYPLWLGGVTGWVSCLGKDAGCAQQLDKTIGWALWLGSTISWTLRLPEVTVQALWSGGPEVMLNKWAWEGCRVGFIATWVPWPGFLIGLYWRACSAVKQGSEFASLPGWDEGCTLRQPRVSGQASWLSRSGGYAQQLVGDADLPLYSGGP